LTDEAPEMTEEAKINISPFFSVMIAATNRETEADANAGDSNPGTYQTI
jgi:hypothetical protein